MTDLSSIISMASAMLERGDFFAALALVGSSNDPHAAAIKGIALAQMGDYEESLINLRSAADAFAKNTESIWLAKVRGAIAEVLLAERHFDAALEELNPDALTAVGDLQSAEYIAIQRARLLNLLNRQAEAGLLLMDLKKNPYSVLAEAELKALNGEFIAAAGLLRSFRSDNPLFQREILFFIRELERPEFSITQDGITRQLTLINFESLNKPVINLVSASYLHIDLLGRPTTAELLTALSEGPVSTTSIFGRSNESLENRLRVEISRIRADLGVAVDATAEGYVMRQVPLVTGPYLAIEALMTDGAAWSANSLALIFGKSRRTIQRSLAEAENTVIARSGRYVSYSLLDRRCTRASQLMVLAGRRNL